MAKKKETLSKIEWMELMERINMLPKEEWTNFAKLFDLYKRVAVEQQPYLLDLVGMFAGVSEDLQTKIPDILDVFLNEIYQSNKVSDDEDFEEDDDFYDDDEISNYPYYKPATDVKRYTLKVSLKDSPTPIWRKFDVPSNITLRHLSELLIDIMGWNGSHLNQFRKGNSYYAPAYQREDELPVFNFKIQNFNQEDFSLADILYLKGKNIEWEYDFGDSWRHEVHLSSINDYKADEPKVIVFKDAEGACPPEDCGGVWGYKELLDIIEKRKSGKRLNAEEREQWEWFGCPKNFNPTYVDAEDIKMIVADFNR